ncbi:hypothetical protein Enr13x_07140 [Stieleria neptunia]|uniref:Uncharacterized protein n=1 Tax=Stieleria neptunia TaxID=2527979 RepID=A0A518HJ56_9BACT|nr:hypothetical protein [Stieleria neptunia]QDV40878.1 hypothetical protein Enr13x_07140 [Stieleria neptunia]
MAKLQNTTVSDADIREFADSASDFGFELRILSTLKGLSIDCEHSGTYDDPVTQRPRQFDIRALVDLGTLRIRLAIECKNLRENFPLVMFEVPRSETESYHDVIFSHEPQRGDSVLSIPIMDSHGAKLRLAGNSSFYPPHEYVGKACSQVGRLLSNDLTGNDAEVYDKWYQAIHSAHDLVDRANNDWESNEQKACVTFVLPILVVPNNRLWRIKYQSDGTRASDPERTSRTTMYIDKFVAPADRFAGIAASFSHLEIVTEQGLADLCNGFLTGDLAAKAFSQDGVKAVFPDEE